LWFDYLSWGNDEMEARHGFRLSVQEAVDRDVADIGRFEPPHGVLLLVSDDREVIGTGAMQRIGQQTAEIKRMWVDPSHRRNGVGRALLDRLVSEAREAGYSRIRLDSPDFAVAAHRLYRSAGFTEIPPYAESEIPDEYKTHWVFLELAVT
jgi:ribosomal protein S18 acetylase RimI-like enzyme